jgi:hypothetical protein
MTKKTPKIVEIRSRFTSESSLVDFGGLDDNPIKGLTSMLSVEQMLNARLIGFNASEQM